VQNANDHRAKLKYVNPDPPEKIVARARFLLRNLGLIPTYHFFESNCKIVAVWCATGEWSSLQVSNAVKGISSAGVKSTIFQVVTELLLIPAIALKGPAAVVKWKEITKLLNESFEGSIYNSRREKETARY